MSPRTVKLKFFKAGHFVGDLDFRVHQPNQQQKNTERNLLARIGFVFGISVVIFALYLMLYIALHS